MLLLRAVEFVTLFVIAPTLYALFWVEWIPPIPMLGILALAAWVVLQRDPRFDRSRLWNAAALSQMLRQSAPTFLIIACLVGTGVWYFRPELFLRLPQERPALWALVMVAYPVLSVYAQELFWRAFLMHRYRSLFRRDPWLIAASALTFGYMHIAFGNVLAVGFTVVGGWLFARTYLRHRSLAAACAEHALYGCFMFTIGLGPYFYAGARP